MRFTLAWLKEYLEFESTVEDLCEKLTSIGLEVEELKNPKKNLDGFTVSEIVEINPHPNASKLNICDVDNGKEIIKIVCGALNVKKNMKTVLANIGCIIKPECKEEFVISKSTIRGVESNGMLCSKEELGLSDESDGIIELDDTSIVGDSFSNYIDDEMIEIEIAITPNRVDCAGVYGIARDLNASGFGTLKTKKIKTFPEKFESKIRVYNKLKNDSCPQISFRQINNVRNVKSPKEIVKRFNGSKLKVISSLVDVTNYLTVDFCRPLHVFDLDKIEGDISIRYSKKGESFFGLDEKSYSLEENMIVICDEKKIISLAGVMGGKNSGCDENTKNILIESAYFLPEKIASTGRKLNIISDARYRFERGIDPNSIADGIGMATEMIIGICGGEVGSIVSDSSPLKSTIEINIEKSFFNKILGHSISENFIEEKLKRIGCEIKSLKENFIVKPPTWRPDIRIKEDLVEEVGRLVGYEKIPNKEFKFNITPETEITSPSQKLKRNIKELLVSRNIMEIISWSFSNKRWEERLNSNNNIFEIENPISSELSCLRTNLVGGLLNIISKNNKKNIQNISIFEMGPIFTGLKPGNQTEHLTVIRSGKAEEKNWTSENRDFDIFDIKSDLISILKLLEIPLNKIRIESDKKQYYHPGKNGSVIFDGVKIANFGEIHPSISKSFKIKNTSILLEFYIQEIFQFLNNSWLTKEKLSKSIFQSSIRDFSFEVDKKLNSIDLVNHIRNIDKEIISEVRIFDNYENKDFRALALEVVIQSDKKTLTEEEINRLSVEIVNEAKSKFKAKLR